MGLVICTWNSCVSVSHHWNIGSLEVWAPWKYRLSCISMATSHKVHVCSVAQSCLTLCNPMDCDPFVHGIFQARILEWVAISSSRGSSWPRDQTCIGRWILYHCVTWEAPILHFILAKRLRSDQPRHFLNCIIFMSLVLSLWVLVWNNTDISHRHYTRWKKPDTK